MGFDPDIFGKAMRGEEVEAPAAPEPVEDSLEAQLQDATKLSLKHIRTVLGAGFDPDNNPLLRAQTAHANHVLTTQVRVEETKFKARQSEDTFNKLLELIAIEKKRLGRI
jgi:ABC-type lipopolysaccharide export system ATPase subunit